MIWALGGEFLSLGGDGRRGVSLCWRYVGPPYHAPLLGPPLESAALSSTA
jgi:hypothetical protein